MNDAIIIAIAYPEVVVKVANGEFVSKLWPLIGVGGKNRVMAGHAALLLISKETCEIDYYDFGRYITSDTFGRVRSKETDHEVAFPFKAIFENNQLVNIPEIAQYLSENPEKTHGYGKVFLGVNYQVNFKKAHRFISNLQNRGEVAYGPFVKDGSNCARFVADAIYYGTTSIKTKRRLLKSYFITPSPLSTVIRGASNYSAIFEYTDNFFRQVQNRSVFKAHLRYFLKKVPQESDDKGSLEFVEEWYAPKNGQWLSGIGSGAWFELSYQAIKKAYLLEIKDVHGNLLSKSLLSTFDVRFKLEKSFEILHGSRADKCLVKQLDRVFELKV